MNNLKEKEVKLLDLQNLTTTMFIISRLISIYIKTIDKKIIQKIIFFGQVRLKPLSFLYREKRDDILPSLFCV